MSERPVKNWDVICEHASDLYPVLIHAGLEPILRSLILRSKRGFLRKGGLPEVTLRIPGLVDPWPIELPPIPEPDGTIVVKCPPAPPINIAPHELNRHTPAPSFIELLINDDLAFRRYVRVFPPTALPPDLSAARAMATLVRPFSPEVNELVRCAKDRFGYPEARLGFPEMSPIAAANALYLQLARSREPSYAWEPAPCSMSQRVRLPSHILAEGQATCVDLALYLCSAIEHIGRLAVVLGVSSDGQNWHVIPGIRTNDDDVLNPLLIEDLTTLRSATASEQIHFFDPDALIKGLNPSRAEQITRERLGRATYGFLLDIHTARTQNMWPLVITSVPTKLPDIATAPKINLLRHHGLPAELVEALARRSVTCIIGDSLDPISAPSKQSLAAHLSAKAGLGTSDLLLAGSVLERDLGREGLVREAQSFLQAHGISDSAVYRTLASLPITTVVSLYPDPRLEHTLMNLSSVDRLINDQDLSRLRMSVPSCELYLLGGSGLTGEGLILTFSDHQHLLRRIEHLGRGLRHSLATNVCLLINCDLADLNLQSLYIAATSHIPTSLCDSYLIGGSPPPSWLPNCTALNTSVSSLLDRLASAVGSTAPLCAAKTHSPSPRNRSPYKYLDYYEPEDRQLFFGREEDIQRLCAEITAAPNRLVVVCGRSGVGKTSLIKAAVAPAFDADRKRVPIYTRCGPLPHVAIVKAVAAHLGLDLNEPDAPNLYRDLLSFRHRDGRHQIIFVDQLEEALLKCAPGVLKEFFSEVGRCLADAWLGVSFVFVLREDYLANLSEYGVDVWGLTSAVYRVHELSREGAREAVIKPAAEAGITVEREMVESLLDDLSPDTILPAHLQIVCYRLYESTRGTGKFTLKAYRDLGSAADILRLHLDTVLEQLPPRLKDTSKLVLRTLVTSEQTKDLLLLSEIAERCELAKPLVADTLFDLIHHQRLVREVLGSPVRFELSHECLAPAIADWMDATEALIRQAQEILQQEVTAFLHLLDYQIPNDRLAIITKYAHTLHFSHDATRVLTESYATCGSFPPSWQARLQGVSLDERYSWLFWNAAGNDPKKLEDILRGEATTFLEELSTTKFPLTACQLVASVIRTGSEDIVEAALDLGLHESASGCVQILFQSTRPLEERRANTVVRGILNHTEALWEAGTPEGKCEFILRLFFAINPSAGPTRKIGRQADSPLVALLGDPRMEGWVADLLLMQPEADGKLAECLLERSSSSTPMFETLASFCLGLRTTHLGTFLELIARFLPRVLRRLGRRSRPDLKATHWRLLAIAAGAVLGSQKHRPALLTPAMRLRIIEVFASQGEASKLDIDAQQTFIKAAIAGGLSSDTALLLRILQGRRLIHLLAYLEESPPSSSEVEAEVAHIGQSQDTDTAFAACSTLISWDEQSALGCIRKWLAESALEQDEGRRRAATALVAAASPGMIVREQVTLLESPTSRHILLRGLRLRANPQWLLEKPEFLIELISRACLDDENRVSLARLLWALMPDLQEVILPIVNANPEMTGFWKRVVEYYRWGRIG